MTEFRKVDSLRDKFEGEKLKWAMNTKEEMRICDPDNN